MEACGKHKTYPQSVGSQMHLAATLVLFLVVLCAEPITASMSSIAKQQWDQAMVQEVVDSLLEGGVFPVFVKRQHLIDTSGDTIETHFDLRGINLDGRHFEEVDLSHCNLSYASVRNGSYVRCNFESAKLFKTDFGNTVLSGSDMKHGASPKLVDL